jgi:hypothetical protein
MTAYMRNQAQVSKDEGLYDVTTETTAGMRLELGTILCKHCGEWIGTLDAQRWTRYYADCRKPACVDQRGVDAASC